MHVLVLVNFTLVKMETFYIGFFISVLNVFYIVTLTTTLKRFHKFIFTLSSY